MNHGMPQQMRQPPAIFVVGFVSFKTLGKTHGLSFSWNTV
jgi:hypothetical protein